MGKRNLEPDVLLLWKNVLDIRLRKSTNFDPGSKQQPTTNILQHTLTNHRIPMTNNRKTMTSNPRPMTNNPRTFSGYQRTSIINHSPTKYQQKLIPLNYLSMPNSDKSATNQNVLTKKYYTTMNRVQPRQLKDKLEKRQKLFLDGVPKLRKMMNATITIKFKKLEWLIN